MLAWCRKLYLPARLRSSISRPTIIRKWAAIFEGACININPRWIFKLFSDPRRPCQPKDQEVPLDHFLHGAIIYVFEAVLIDLSTAVLMVNGWDDPIVLFVFHPSSTNKKLMDDLLEVDGVIFDDGFGPHSQDHKWAYEKLEDLHVNGQMTVLRVWYTTNRYATKTTGSTASNSTVANKSNVNKVSNSTSREQHRSRSTHSIEMRDATTPESTKTPEPLDSVYSKSSPSLLDQRLSPSFAAGQNIPTSPLEQNTPPSPSMQLLDTF
jgi:hypothetical protein